MPLPPVPSPTTVAGVPTLLDEQFRTFALGVAADRYALWLGSGISRGVVPGLDRVVGRVIEFLRSHVDFNVADCRFRRALNDALGLVLSQLQRAQIDISRPFSTWPEAAAITDNLILNYARLLETEVAGEEDDFTLWNGVGIAEIYADPTLQPGVEHYCIAILILEGVASQIASANWDGLVEKAVAEISGAAQVLTVCARPEDVRDLRQRARLIKFHGCAVKAAADETAYRPYLVGRQSQIYGWTANPANRSLVNQLLNLAITRPTLMAGLSAQDANIQAVFAEAEAHMAWPWPGDLPSCVFSQPEIGTDQKGLLRNVYRETFTPATREQITAGSVVPVYANPLLVSLVLHVIGSKLNRLIELAVGRLDAAEKERLQEGVAVLRDHLAAQAEPDRLAFIQAFVQGSSRAIMMFRDGESPVGPRLYNPITSIPVQQMEADMALPTSGLPEAAVATALIGIGLRDGAWTIQALDPGDPTCGMIEVVAGAGPTKIFFAESGYVEHTLRENGHLVDDDAIIVHSRPAKPAMRRSPRAAPGRTGKVASRTVSIADLLTVAADTSELFRLFRQEVAL